MGRARRRLSGVFLDPGGDAPGLFAHGDAPGLFAHAAPVKNQPKRLGDTDRSERPGFDHVDDGVTDTGTIVEELTAGPKRKKKSG